MAVGVAEHDDLMVAARTQVLAIQLVVEQALHDLRRALDVLARLEQRRDVERHGFALRAQVAPLREQQHRQDVVRPVRHADDIRPDRVSSVLTPAVGDRLEDGQRAAAFGRQRPERRFASLERLLEPSRALLVVGGEPALLLQRLADDAPVNERVLADIDGREVEAEGTHAPQQAAHCEQAGIAALVRAQAVGHELEVGDELVRRFVGKRVVVVGGLEPRGHEAQIGAIRHLPVAHRQRSRGLGKVSRVFAACAE